MAKTARLIALSAASLLLANSAGAIGALSSPSWSASAYAHMPVFGHATAWTTDYGIIGGHCNASQVGTIVDEAQGGDGRLVATLHGPLLGDTPALDAVDRGCMGHALELAPSFFAVRWTNPETHSSFIVMPMRRLTLHGAQCRLFSAMATIQGEAYLQRATACRFGHGEWYLI